MQSNIKDIKVLFEDDDFIAINKPSGLIVHPKGIEHAEESVLDFILPLTSDNLENRQGIIHRLDRLTSGVMLLAKNSDARQHAQEQFAKRTIKKEYTAVAYGRPKNEEFIVDLPIQRNPKLPATYRVNPSGKKSVSRVKVVRSDNDFSLLSVRPKTGRTHQIRVHLQYIGCPIANDPFYSKGREKVGSGRLMLHSNRIEFQDMSGSSVIVESKVPDEFNRVVDL